MKNYLKLMVLFLLVMGLTSPVSALTGQDIYDKCGDFIQQAKGKGENAPQTVASLLDAGSCAGFVGGVLSGINLVGGMMKEQGIAKRNFICLPGKVHSQMLLKELITHLESSEDVRNLPGQVVVYRYFANKYPCQEAPE